MNQPFLPQAGVAIMVVVPAVVSHVCSPTVSFITSAFQIPAQQIVEVLILGIVLAITFCMHRLVPMMIDRADLRARFRDVSAQSIFRHACPSVAMRDLQGGRWTKDWCGGDQQWRLRLSGRGWTDRRRSG